MRFEAVTSFFLASLAIIACNKNKPGSKPNIILIMADDMGFECLSCYGSLSYKTPVLDSLASHGMLFGQCHSQPLSTPSRVKLMTGLYSYRNYDRFEHLSRTPGSDKSLKPPTCQTPNLDHLADNGMRFTDFYCGAAVSSPSHKDPTNFFRNGEPVGQLTGYSCQLVVNEAIEWLDSREDQKNPFYVNIWFNEPHEKVAAPEELTSRHAYNSAYYGAIENLDLAAGIAF